VRVLETIREQHEQRAWQRYGFVDAFNPLTNWYSQDVIGIDLGITLVMAENARTGFVWEQFMKNEVAEAGMARAGFHRIGAGETATSANPATASGSPLRSVR
jgi:hypothetical protein